MVLSLRSALSWTTQNFSCRAAALASEYLRERNSAGAEGILVFSYMAATFAGVPWSRQTVLVTGNYVIHSCL